MLAIAGFPPMGIFMSEFLVVASTFARQPLLTIPLVLGILVGAEIPLLMELLQRIRRQEPGSAVADLSVVFAFDVPGRP